MSSLTKSVSTDSQNSASASTLPLTNETKKCLTNFGQFVARNKDVVDAILHLVPQNDSENLSPSLVQVFDLHGTEETLKERAIEFIHVDRNSDVVSFLRENSLAVTVLSRSNQLYGRNYLKEVIHYRVKKIIKSKLNCEIDPSRLGSEDDLQKNLQNLIKVTKSILSAVWKSPHNVPFYVKDTLVKIHDKLKHTGITPLQIVGTFFFLRFITPVVSGAVSDTKTSKEGQRTLILVAKLIQLIANKISTLEASNFLKITEPFLNYEIPKAEKFAEAMLDVSERADNRPVKTRSSRDIERGIFDIYLWLKKNSEGTENYLTRNFGEISANNFREQMRLVHTSFGSDATVAEDWQKVWKRVQRLKLAPVSSSESTLSWAESISEYTSHLSSDSSSSVDDDNSQSNDTSQQEEDPSFTTILKCFHPPSKKLKFIILETPSFIQLVGLVQKKFGLPNTQPLQFSYHHPNAGNDGENTLVYVEDETSFNEFMDNQGVAHGTTFVYSIYVQ